MSAKPLDGAAGAEDFARGQAEAERTLEQRQKNAADSGSREEMELMLEQQRAERANAAAKAGGRQF